MNVNVCFSPVLYPYYTSTNDRTVVVVDVFRATTTICAALNNGAKSIIPVATVEEAQAYKEKGYLVGGERNIVKFEFGDFGNTPSEYSREKVSGKDIVISTTNGTRAIDMAQNSDKLVIGSFSNLSAVTQFCSNRKKDVMVLCAGWQNTFNIEDALFAGALVERLTECNAYNGKYDAATVALAMWKEAKTDITRYIQRSEHWNRMKLHGLVDVASFCLEHDTTNVVPLYDTKTKKIMI